MPLKIKSVEEETTSPRRKSPPAIEKGKEKVDDSASVVEPWKEVVYDPRRAVPFKPDTRFPELGYKGMVTHFNMAATQMISETDVSHLDCLQPLDRVRQLQASAAEVFSVFLDPFLINIDNILLSVCHFIDFSKDVIRVELQLVKCHR